MENFKDIIYRGAIVSVGDMGTIINNGKLRTHRINKDGYLVVSILDGDRKSLSVGVHRLVALAHIDNDDKDKIEVNHIDCNRCNPQVTNLEWVTHKQNVMHSRNKGRYPSQKGELNNNYGNKKLSEMYSSNKGLSIEKQSRKGSVNGKSKSIKLYDCDVYVGEFSFIGELCEYIKTKYEIDASINSIRISLNKCRKKNIKYKNRFTTYV